MSWDCLIRWDCSMLRVRPERETDGRWEESSQAVTRVTRCLEWAPPATMSPCLHTLLNTNISCKNGKFNLILRIFFSLFFITFWNWGWDDVKANLRSSMMMPLDCTSVIPSRTIGPLGQSRARAHNSRMKVRPRRRRSYLLQHLISAPFFRHLD